MSISQWIHFNICQESLINRGKYKDLFNRSQVINLLHLTNGYRPVLFRCVVCVFMVSDGIGIGNDSILSFQWDTFLSSYSYHPLVTVTKYLLVSWGHLERSSIGKFLIKHYAIISWPFNSDQTLVQFNPICGPLPGHVASRSQCQCRGFCQQSSLKLSPFLGSNLRHRIHLQWGQKCECGIPC